MNKARPPLKIMPHSANLKDVVRALNERMRAQGKWGFFEDAVPGWLPFEPGSETYREYFVALDQTGPARGGYVLRHELASFSGEMRRIASVQGPYSEGAIDRRYAWVVFAMIRDMLERQPNLYGWGLRGAGHLVLKLFGAVGWRSYGAPVLGCLLQGNELSAGPLEGAGEEVERFEDWADVLWSQASAEYGFVVLRNQHVLNRLYPTANRSFVRLLVHRRGQVIGWAVLGVRSFEKHPLFGSARIGVIWDFFGRPADAPVVVRAAKQHLIALQATAAASCVSHVDWIAAFEENHFRRVGDEQFLLVSRPLDELLNRSLLGAAACLLTYGDAESYQGWLGRAFFDL